jgi:UDP-N-acetylglucosamine transferase subunit ALG13
MDIFVTVGMGRWPFDRLIEALRPLCQNHSLTVQSGMSKVILPCTMLPFLSFNDFMTHLQDAQIIITHAGNSVRIAQRMGKVPIAMAREARYKEMANDHQVKYLIEEAKTGLVVPLWDSNELLNLVERHAETQNKLLKERRLPSPARSEDVVNTMNRLCEKWIKK